MWDVIIFYIPLFFCSFAEWCVCFSIIRSHPSSARWQWRLLARYWLPSCRWVPLNKVIYHKISISIKRVLFRMSSQYWQRHCTITIMIMMWKEWRGWRNLKFNQNTGSVNVCLLTGEHKMKNKHEKKIFKLYLVNERGSLTGERALVEDLRLYIWLISFSLFNIVSYTHFSSAALILPLLLKFLFYFFFKMMASVKINLVNIISMWVEQWWFLKENLGWVIVSVMILAHFYND